MIRRERSCEFPLLNQATDEPSETSGKSMPRKQLLLRCGWKFYYVYEDDRTLVESQDQSGGRR